MQQCEQERASGAVWTRDTDTEAGIGEALGVLRLIRGFEYRGLLYNARIPTQPRFPPVCQPAPCPASRVPRP